MTRRRDIKREKGGRWWQFWQHGRDRAARRTPSEFREMVLRGCGRDWISYASVTFSPRPVWLTPLNHPIRRLLRRDSRTRLYSIIKDRYWIKRDSATDFAPRRPRSTNPPFTMLFDDNPCHLRIGFNVTLALISADIGLARLPLSELMHRLENQARGGNY